MCLVTYKDLRYDGGMDGLEVDVCLLGSDTAVFTINRNNLSHSGNT